jgi:hypothetical protein
MILKPNKDKCGYVHYRLTNSKGKTELWKGHQLVGLTYLNYNRKNKDSLVLDHINRNKT